MKIQANKQPLIKCIYDYDNSKCQALEYTGNNKDQVIKFIGESYSIEDTQIQFSSLTINPGQIVVKDLDHNDWYAYGLPVFNKYFKKYE